MYSRQGAKINVRLNGCIRLTRDGVKKLGLSVKFFTDTNTPGRIFVSEAPDSEDAIRFKKTAYYYNANSIYIARKVFEVYGIKAGQHQSFTLALSVIHTTPNNPVYVLEPVE